MAMAYVKVVMAFHQQLQPKSCMTSFRALPLAAAICLCVDEVADGYDFLFVPCVRSMSLYTNFLQQTGRWTGTSRELEELRIFYRRTTIAFDAVGPRQGFEWSVPSQTEELEFLEGTPLAKQAHSLLTDLDKQLRSASAVPWREALSAAVADFATDAPYATDAYNTGLAIFRGLGLNPFTGSAERLARIRKTLSDGDDLERLILLGTLAYACFEDAFSLGSDPYHEESRIGQTLGRILAKTAATTGAVSGLILTNPGALMPAGLTPETAELYTEVGRQLKYLHELGLVVIGQDITIPTALRRCVLDVWDDAEDNDRAA